MLENEGDEVMIRNDLPGLFIPNLRKRSGKRVDFLEVLINSIRNEPLNDLDPCVSVKDSVGRALREYSGHHV